VTKVSYGAIFWLDTPFYSMLNFQMMRVCVFHIFRFVTETNSPPWLVKWSKRLTCERSPRALILKDQNIVEKRRAFLIPKQHGWKSLWSTNTQQWNQNMYINIYEKKTDKGSSIWINEIIKRNLTANIEHVPRHLKSEIRKSRYTWNSKLFILIRKVGIHGIRDYSWCVF